jgi:hypothetical protein
VEDRDLAEVVDAGGVEQNEIYHCNLYHIQGFESIQVGAAGRFLRHASSYAGPHGPHIR